MRQSNVPVTRAQMDAFKANPEHNRSIGGLNGGVPNRRERRAHLHHRSSTKVPEGSPFRLTYIKNMTVKKAIDKHGGLFGANSPKVSNVKHTIKSIKSIREIKQSRNANKGNVEVS